MKTKRKSISKKKMANALAKELHKASADNFGLKWWTIVATVGIDVLKEKGYLK